MTREQAREAAAVMLGWADGKEVQKQRRGTGEWLLALYPNWNWDLYTYRLKPTPALRPWTAWEVPVGAIIRYKRNPHSIRMLIVCNEESGLTGRDSNWPYITLLDVMEHSTDGGLTWKPCGVEEVVK